MKNLFLALLVIAASGCDRDNSLPPTPPKDALSASARVELKLPAEGELTLATEADTDFVAELTPGTVQAVEQHLKSSGEKIAILAARPVGDYLLLWIDFPDVLDGGIDLIWSVEDQQYAGEFLGGLRG